jgi:integrase
VNLTKATIAKLALGSKSERIVFDDTLPGLGLRLREGGSKTWIYQYAIGTKQRRLTLGKLSALEPAKAREIASDIHARIRLGEDPAATKAESRMRISETFGAAIGPYLAWQRGRVRASTLRHIERHLTTNLAPLHDLHIAKIDRRAIAQQLTRLSVNSPVQANRTRSSLARFFRWAAGEGLVENNPVLFTNRNAEKPRERTLNDIELATVWRVLPEDDFGDILRLLILTGQREREISDLRWDEIDFERNVIVLPPPRTKNGRRHSIPMAPMVRSILEARPQNGRSFVFGRGENGFSGWSKSKRRLDETIKIPPWRIHDLRRSCATGLSEAGVFPHIVESILNHVSGTRSGVAGLYNKAAHENEKALALTRWSQHVAAIVGRDSNVTPLRGVS